MPKTIIFAADGTWNGPSVSENNAAEPTSNVFKLFAHLAGMSVFEDGPKGDEQVKILTSDAGAPMQVAKYIHGVGDANNFLVKVLGGALGSGLITRIVRGYTFISRVYAPGDRIFLVGFSRGAYTVRALGGLIAGRGLLDGTRINLDDRDNAYRLGAAVWFDYRRTAMHGDPSLLGRLQQMAVDMPAFLTFAPTGDRIADVPIQAIAVWDTVGSLGIPEYNAKSARLETLRFIDTKLSSKVRKGFHAVAIDELRSDFTPTLWDSDPGRITQVLFPGAHADVGGGYPGGPESGLSNAALKWMTDVLRAEGVVFAPDWPAAYQDDPHAPSHQPWRHSPFDILPKGPRDFPGAAALVLHPSVRLRMQAAKVFAEPNADEGPYRPGNIGPYL